VLLEGAAAAGCGRVVFSSSCAVYGHPPATPIPEDVPLAPANPYGETKREFERLLAEYASADGATVFSLRYFNAAGATAHHGEDHIPRTHLIPNVLRVASGGQPALEIQGRITPHRMGRRCGLRARAGHCRRARAGARGGTGGSDTTGKGHRDEPRDRVGYSVLAVAEAARRVTAERFQRWHDPPPRRSPELVAAAGRAEAVLGWRPRHSGLEEISRARGPGHQAHPHGYGN